jgi:hypothetical protein
MKTAKIEIKNPKKKDFVIRILQEFGMVEVEPGIFIDKEPIKQTKPKKLTTQL